MPGREEIAICFGLDIARVVLVCETSLLIVPHLTFYFPRLSRVVFMRKGNFCDKCFDYFRVLSNNKEKTHIARVRNFANS